jgi:hypothetical protein
VPSAYHNGSYHKVFLFKLTALTCWPLHYASSDFSFLFPSVTNQLTAFFRLSSRHWRHQIRDSSPESFDYVTVCRHV